MSSEDRGLLIIPESNKKEIAQRDSNLVNQIFPKLILIQNFYYILLTSP